jgi:hypothetical protein
MTDAISSSATAPPAPHPRARAVLLPLDGSPTAGRALAPALPGSDAARTVHLSPAPVLVVPAGDPDVTT